MGGKSFKRVDVLAKVNGKAKYAGDIKLENMLHMKVVRSPYPHARIKGIDKSKAMEAEGVVAVFTAEDLPNKKSGVHRPVLVSETARYAGDGIALVVAETEAAAAEGARLVEVDYEILPAVFDPEEALKEGTVAIHGDSNIVTHWKINKGNLEEGFKEADIILEREYSTHAIYQGHMETEAAIAEPTAEGVTIYCPSKLPNTVRDGVAASLKMQQNQVRMIQPAIGGSFGAKGPDAVILSARVALAALLTGRPCKAVYSREESIIEGAKRHPYKMKYKVGATKEGRLTAMEIRVVADAGAYCNETERVTARSTVEATGPYEIPNIKVDVIGVYTNQVNSDAARGFGSPQVDFASEQLMDELADKLNIDKFKIRRINGFKEGSISATGQVMKSVSLDECLDRLEETLDWEKRKKELEIEVKDPVKARGIGISCMFRGESKGSAAIDTAGVNIHTQPDGSIIVYAGIAEVGQGGYTMLVSVVSQVLGVNPERVHVSSFDSNYCPDGGPTAASRGTVTSGNAARLAAEQIKNKLACLAAEKLRVAARRLVFEDGKIKDRENSEQAMTFEEAVKECYSKGENVYGFGWWSSPETTWNYETGDVSDCEPYFSYVYGANGAEVEVDLITGKVDVLKFVAVHDVGHALNEEEVKNQIAGGVNMGIGYALTEDLKMEKGIIRNTNYCKYLMPTALDISNVIPVIVEHPGAEGPLGAKGLAEPSTSIVAPAILNAIADAIGCRINNLPASLERVRITIETEKERRNLSLPANKVKVSSKMNRNDGMSDVGGNK